MAQTQTVEHRVRDFVLKQFPLARKNGIKAEDNWIESGLIDSLGILDLVHFLEAEFSIHISDEELSAENFGSLAAVVSFVETKQGAKIA